MGIFVDSKEKDEIIDGTQSGEFGANGKTSTLLDSKKDDNSKKGMFMSQDEKGNVTLPKWVVTLAGILIAIVIYTGSVYSWKTGIEYRLAAAETELKDAKDERKKIGEALVTMTDILKDSNNKQTQILEELKSQKTTLDKISLLAAGAAAISDK